MSIGLDVVREYRLRGGELPWILVSGYMDYEIAREAGNAMVTAAENAFTSYIEPQDGPCGLGCTHADWRCAAGGYY